MLSLSEYSTLPQGLQSALLLKDGIPLFQRPMPDQEQRVLYSLGSFFVEVSWDRDWTMQYILPFRNTDKLNPYLVRINWHEFV
ncbi:hypothetical protein [Spirosoma sp. KNUC1025]|uniref:hypothetical protein n=1 Tax=Spirosoma sp. KNUC1025 TaxID=2894082 RepID=UPI003867C9F7|nr:hypothetical protein LN737_20465 [Spirosoma sp. KNUC1025]